MRQTLILISCVCLFSCNDNNKAKEPSNNFVLQHNPLKVDHFSFINNITDVNTLIAALNNQENLQGASVGLAGKRSLSYAYFERLKTIASDSALLGLTYHTNPKLRVYGMWALAANNRPLALNQLRRFRKDTTSITYHAGCIIQNLPINYLVETCFDSTEIASNRAERIVWRTY